MEGMSIHRLLLFVLLMLAGVSCAKRNGLRQSVAADKPRGPVLSENQEIQLKSAFMEAHRQKMQGNHDEARKHFEACLGIVPQHAASLYELASLDVQRSDYRSAIENLQKATAIDPNNKWYSLSLAMLFENTKQYDKSADVYLKLIKNEPGEAAYYESLANMYILQGDIKKALKVYDEMESRFGVSEMVNTQKQRIYMSLGKTDKAIEEAKKLIEAAPGTARYYNNLADLYNKSGNTAMAVKTYEKLLEIDPENSSVQLSMAVYYLEAGEKEKARKTIKTAFENPELDIETKARLLLNNIAYKDVPKGSVNPFAFELAQAMIDAHPNDYRGFAIKGDFHAQLNQKDTAIDLYVESIERDNNQFAVWNQLMFLYTDLERWDELQSKSSTAMTLFPTQALFYYMNGLANAQKEAYREAIDAYIGGVDYVVDNPAFKEQFYINLADAYHNIKEHEKSDMYFDKVLVMNPDNSLVLNNYSYYLSLRGEKLERAEEMSRKAVNAEPDSPTFLDTYAWVLYQRKNYTEALKWMQFALNNGGDKEDIILEHYGDILYRLDRREEALQFWKRARGLGKGSEFLDEKIKTGKLVE
jgi:pentatricopeptide repeat protein